LVRKAANKRLKRVHVGWTAHIASQTLEMMMVDMKNGILGVVSAVHDV